MFLIRPATARRPSASVEHRHEHRVALREALRNRGGATVVTPSEPDASHVASFSSSSTSCSSASSPRNFFGKLRDDFLPPRLRAQDRDTEDRQELITAKSDACDGNAASAIRKALQERGGMAGFGAKRRKSALQQQEAIGPEEADQQAKATATADGEDPAVAKGEATCQQKVSPVSSRTMSTLDAVEELSEAEVEEATTLTDDGLESPRLEAAAPNGRESVSTDCTSPRAEAEVHEEQQRDIEVQEQQHRNVSLRMAGTTSTNAPQARQFSQQPTLVSSHCNNRPKRVKELQEFWGKAHNTETATLRPKQKLSQDEIQAMLQRLIATGDKIDFDEVRRLRKSLSGL